MNKSCDQSLAIGVALVCCCGARFGFSQFLCLLPGFAGVYVLLLTDLLDVVYFWGLWFVVLALCPNSSEGGVVLGGLGFEQLRLWFSYLLVQAGVQGSVLVRFSDTSRVFTWVYWLEWLLMVSLSVAIVSVGFRFFAACFTQLSAQPGFWFHVLSVLRPLCCSSGVIAPPQHFVLRHCKGEAQAITKHALLTGLVVFERTELDHVGDLMHAEPDGFTLSVLDRLFSKGLRTVKSTPPNCRLGFSRFLRVVLDKVICKPDDVACWVSLLVLPLCLLKTFNPGSNLECKSANKRRHEEKSIANAIRSWGVPRGSFQLVRETLAESAPPMLDLDREDLDLTDRNLKQCKRKICDGHYTAAVRVLSSSGVAPYNDATLQELKTKHPFMSAPSLLDSHIDHHPLIAS
ncbi:hypothetical protein Tco_0882975 [Tanacetum coccineum]